MTDSPAMVVCQSCGRINDEGAAFCQYCGQPLGAAGSGSTAMAPAGFGARGYEAPAPGAGEPGPPAEYLVTHRGRTFGVGYGPTFYGVWDLRVGGSPVAWFDRTPVGWEAAWRRFQELEGAAGLPSWRRAHPGWVLLHIVIGAAMWFGQIVLLGAVLAGAGRATELENLPEETQRAIGGPVLLSLLTSLAGWLLFVYLRSSVRTRWLVLTGALVLGFTVLVAVTLSEVPRV
jgi:hypothetical protein